MCMGGWAVNGSLEGSSGNGSLDTVGSVSSACVSASGFEAVGAFVLIVILRFFIVIGAAMVVPLS
jgi:hypothetical protein